MIDEAELGPAVAFHGHLCPGLAMGVRAAEVALERIGRSAGDEEVVAIVETDMCGVDAIEFLTGCTFGKGNLVHRDHGKNAYTFLRRSDGRAVRVATRRGPGPRARAGSGQAGAMAKAAERTAPTTGEERWRAHGALAAQATALVAGARALASCFEGGGTLFASGGNPFASDAEHVSVEFLHPVIVGLPALPSVPLVDADRATLEALGRPGDALVTLGPSAGALVGPAHEGGLATLALGGGPDGGGGAAVPLATTSPWLAKELCVTGYHLLWELTHLFLGASQSSPAADLGATAALYPFLDGGDRSGEDADAVRSTGQKIDEVAGMRQAALEADAPALERCAAALAARLRAGGRVLTCGNGGSSTDAASLATALRFPPAALPALSLAADRATVTALANDVGFERVFARQVAAIAKEGDVLVGMSTSGGSANVLEALAEARRRGVLTVGFAGYDGGAMASEGLVDHLFVVPSPSVHRIQEVQATLYLTLRAQAVSALGHAA